ncbi:rho GTPase-activating protein 100F-like isoform X1 [Rhopalosiphum padi]|uniref:rho GTPase-activating protein 100F-like isoform X1 n=1 Tax=Rhopalosiphum padi TaxID=40932 RepID=UPI00298E2A08|nr:rho GTPase-activating protein 100F-like isoform X1 [Rhopalosiphum padi]
MVTTRIASTNKRSSAAMLCCARKKGRDRAQDLASTSRHGQQPLPAGTKTKDALPVVLQSDFRKLSGISKEDFRLIDTIENEYDATTAAALDAVQRRGEMVVRILDPRIHLTKTATDAAKKFLMLQDSNHIVNLVEIIKRPGQTLGLYIREGNGINRHDGLFISRLALESAVYNSGCIQVGDEVLAVNLVDVTRKAVDEVVIIMSIPRRLVLALRQTRGMHRASVNVSLASAMPSHQPPVVVIKKDLSRESDDQHDDDDDDLHMKSYMTTGRVNQRNKENMHEQRRRESRGRSQSQLALDSNGDISGDLYYNSRPPESRRQVSTLDRRNNWSYQPPHPPVSNEQPKSQHFQPFDKAYPKTLESLAEKVHPFCPGGQSSTGRRMSATTTQQQYRRNNIPRSGSDQYLPRSEYDYGNRPYRQSQTLMRSGLRSSAGAGSGTRLVSQYSQGSSRTLPRHLDYASDTEATKVTSTSPYYYRGSSQISGVSNISRLQGSSTISRSNSLRSNSLPRDIRTPRTPLSSLNTSLRGSLRRYNTQDNPKISSSLLSDHEDSDGNLSAPEFQMRRKNRLVSSPSVFTADEYRAWMSRAPSTSAIYDRIRNVCDPSLKQQKVQRFTFSAENLPERTRHSELMSYSGTNADLRPFRGLGSPALPSATTSTLDRHTRTSSLRRIRHLLELEAKHLGRRSPSSTSDLQADRARVLEINPAEFLKYKFEKTTIDNAPPISGLLWVHLLAGRGLRATPTTVLPGQPTNVMAATGSSRDLYCVLECDRVHKARTVVRTGDLVFDWDETFELDLLSNKELDFLIYSWDQQYRHKLCYKGSVHLASLVRDSPVHQLALKIEPRGTLYLRLRHTDPYQTFIRKTLRTSTTLPPRTKTAGLFGIDLESVVTRESGAISSSLSSLAQAPATASVPVIVRRCIEEVERRGLDIIGLYRLCGSASKKRILREAFERNPRTVDLSPDNVPDINVITGVLKDYLRELPEPLFTRCLYQMLLDALTVLLPDDPQANAKLMLSILDCLPKLNRATLTYIMDHLALVVSQSPRNKMSAQNLSICLAPVLMVQSEVKEKPIDFQQPVNVLRYLLEIWPTKSVRECLPPSVVNGVTRPPPLPAKPSCVPAVPTRRVPPPVIVASPTSDTATSDDDDDDDNHGHDGTAIEPPQIPARSNAHRLTKVAAPDPEENAAETPSSSTGTEDSQRDVAERAAEADEESCGEEQLERRPRGLQNNANTAIKHNAINNSNNSNNNNRQ